MRIQNTKPFFDSKQIAGITRDLTSVLKTGRLMFGEYTKKFEENFARYIGVKHAISVNSCTTALTIALRHFNVKNREVIVPSNTFISSPNSIIYAGGKPVFAEINEKTICLDSDDLQGRITKKTKGIMIVHLAGLITPDIKAIKDICEDKDLFLIEDCAHASGASIGNIKAGNLGNAGCFSFFPTKVMTTGTGGMITTNDPKLAEYARKLRFFGMTEDRKEVIHFASDWFMNEVSSVLGLHQLKNLEKTIKKRNRIAETYDKGLKGLKTLRPLEKFDNVTHSYYKYCVYNESAMDNYEAIKLFKKRYGIDLAVMYDPCHLYKIYRERYGFREGYLPRTESILKKILTLPMYQSMNDKELRYVIKCIKEVFD